MRWSNYSAISEKTKSTSLQNFPVAKMKALHSWRNKKAIWLFELTIGIFRLCLVIPPTVFSTTLRALVGLMHFGNKTEKAFHLPSAVATCLAVVLASSDRDWLIYCDFSFWRKCFASEIKNSVHPTPTATMQKCQIAWGSNNCRQWKVKDTPNRGGKSKISKTDKAYMANMLNRFFHA